MIPPGSALIGTLHNILLNPPPMCESRTDEVDKFVLINKDLILFVISHTSSANIKYDGEVKNGPEVDTSTPGPTPAGCEKPYHH